MNDLSLLLSPSAASPAEQTSSGLEIATLRAEVARLERERDALLQQLSEEDQAPRKAVLTIRHELALKASNIGVWDWLVESNHLIWDEQMYRLYGIAEADFESAYAAWLAGVHPDDRQESDQAVKDALAGRRDFNTEFRVVWPDGEVRHIRAHATVIRNASGEPIRMLGVNRDITEQRRKDREIQMTAQELIRANAELEQFVYFASHDLQAPLRHISSFVSLIQGKLADDLDPDVEEWMKFVTKGTAKMKRLVEDLLLYSRLGRANPPHEDIDLAETFSSAAEILNGAARSPVLQLELGPLPTLRAGRTQLARVAQNLLQNAVKYAKPGVGARVQVSAEERANQWIIHVKDSGIGIAPEHHERIFQPFQKLSHNSAEGTGIGLAICTKIIDALGGQLGVESSAGNGAVFSISVPKQAGGA